MQINYPAEKQIRSRAYQIYQEHGRQPGHDIDNWLQAEYELMQLPVHKIAELEPPQVEKSTRKSLVFLVRTAILLAVSYTAASQS